MMRAAKAGEREAAAHVEEARAGYLPRVDYVESWQRGNDPVYVFGSLLTEQRFTAANFDLERPQPPGSPDQPPGDVRRPAADLRQREARGHPLGRPRQPDCAADDRPRRRADLALGVTRVYGMVLQAIAGRKAADAAVDTARDDLTRTEQRRDAGTGHRGGRPVAEGLPRPDAGAADSGRERRGHRAGPAQSADGRPARQGVRAGRTAAAARPARPRPRPTTRRPRSRTARRSIAPTPSSRWPTRRAPRPRPRSSPRSTSRGCTS